MATIQLVLELPSTFQDTFVATWDIIDAHMKISARGCFFAEGSASAQLADAGSYWARVQLPNGETQSQPFEIANADDSIEIRFSYAPPSRHEWLSWASVEESPGMVDQIVDNSALNDLWTRAWALHDGRWVPTQDAVDARLDQDVGLYQLEFESPGTTPMTLQIGGREVASRFVILPAQGYSRLLIVTTPHGKQSDEVWRDRIEVAVSLRNSIADNLMRFLTVAQPGTDAGWDRDLREKSLGLLSGKVQDPLAAVVGGYFVVQDKSSLPSDWLSKLAMLTPWMADGHILFANALVLRGSRSDASLAIEHLSQAAQRGYPVFRRGVRLFLDTLRILESNQGIEIPKRLQSQARQYALASAADTRQSAFTSFYGTRPDSPDTQRINLHSTLFAKVESSQYATGADNLTPALMAATDLESFGVTQNLHAGSEVLLPSSLGGYGIRKILTDGFDQ